MPATGMSDPGPSPSKWADLGTRIASAVVLLAVAAGALWIGGVVWFVLVALVAAVMGWELAGLCDTGLGQGVRLTLGLGLVAPLAVMAYALLLPGADATFTKTVQIISWGVMLLALLPGLWLLGDGRSIWAGYGLMIQFGAQYFLYTGIDPWGLIWLISVVAIVMISDILGYFAGRFIGGPKFWPKISPKKTWSGTVAGWIGAGLFGALVMSRGDLIGSVPLGILAAVAIAFAGQMGDIAASKIKRRVGVKDASNLIPGHGGFMDRLDAMIAAGAMTILWMLVF